MPTTRSQSRGTPSSTPAPVKRKADDADAAASASKAKKPRSTKAKPSTPRVAKDAVSTESQLVPPPPPPTIPGSEPEKILPAILTFDYAEAKRHLISVDSRFEELFKRLPCKPYEQLETVHPFRALTMSILGQQISWLAARSINHRFRRLYDPTLPEKPTQHSDSRDPEASFPTPAQVANTAIPTLRSAGLSQRKAEYIQDLARRFADGSLSTDKLLQATDEELAEMLIAVKGIGRWTVDMFAMFSLRRPNILPVGDLGVQRGLARWVLALHSEKDPVAISPQKLSDQDREAHAQASAAKEDQSSAKRASSKRGATPKAKDKDAVPDVASMLAPQESSVLPVEGDLDGVAANVEDEDSDGPLPPPFTPSVNKVLARGAEDGPPPPLPAGLSVTELRTRLTGKKKIKGALLTPAEMEAMTEAWKPYRSLGVYYMWTLSEGE
ncbi:DNA glycosylase [Schizophyllum commune H4-8]|uniref:DNA glycosylase n=1 Tax=Schizophyllum commune (strain H4-8 / FGSC 9210) TaxID=578458 RepID=UPI00215E7640|nr:DNA glycosylase [Schizophyllum commune H4-8]KAI5889661.1 DNA glycosylase [Schizophyllum commune H4-8]